MQTSNNTNAVNVWHIQFSFHYFNLLKMNSVPSQARTHPLWSDTHHHHHLFFRESGSIVIISLLPSSEACPLNELDLSGKKWLALNQSSFTLPFFLFFNQIATISVTMYDSWLTSFKWNSTPKELELKSAPPDSFFTFALITRREQHQGGCHGVDAFQIPKMAKMEMIFSLALKDEEEWSLKGEDPCRGGFLFGQGMVMVVVKGESGERKFPSTCFHCT